MGKRVEMVLKANVQKKGRAQHADANEYGGNGVGLHPEADVDAKEERLLDGQVG